MTARALGICVRTGWAACVVAGGSLREPEIVANEVVIVLGGAERFCFHAASRMALADAAAWIDRVRAMALVNARRSIGPLVAERVAVCAIVAKEGSPRGLESVLASHALIHAAEGCFYRDVFRDACPVPVRVIPPSRLDAATVGRLARPPWGRDQKLAALAAWAALRG
jgi:hypothetical protein